MTSPIAQVTPPEFSLTAQFPDAVDVVALPVSADGEDLVLGPGAEALGERWGIDLLALADVLEATAKSGSVTTFPVPSTNPEAPPVLVLLAGVGDQTPTDFRRAGAAIARAARDHGRVATSVAAIADRAGFEAFIVGVMLGSFSFQLRSGSPTSVPVGHVVLAGLPEAADRAAEVVRATAIGMAGWRARYLATLPSNIKNPPWLADQARELADRHGLECEIWDEKRLVAEGCGGIVGVGQASDTPPRLIRLDYLPPGVNGKEAAKLPRVVLVGKGITFDSGGLSIKPAEGMVTMKRDMTGGGVVLATMAALSAVGCPIRVTGLVAAAENAINGNALRPGDVLRHFGGRTSEVTNTDAEGRLVLADALAFAAAKLSPAAIVDVATLTGAMKVALGQRTGGYFANHEGLASAVEAASAASGEVLWRFPLWEDYEEKLSSKIADANNAPGGAGAITAALFLQHFVGDVPWAHLDVASVGDSPTDHHEWTTGPTGFGARALLSWLGQDNPLEGIA